MARTEGLRMAGGGDAVACCENSARKKAVRFARGPFPKYNDGHPPEKSCEEERRRYRKGLTLQRMMPPPPPPPPSMMMMPCSSSPDDDLDFNVNWFEQAVMSSTSSLAASTALSLASSSPSVAGAGAFDPCRGCHQAQQLVTPSLTIVPPACVRFPSDLEDGPSDTALMIVDDDERAGGVPDGRGGPEDHDHDDDDDDDVLAPGTVLETIALHPEPPNLCRDSVTSIEEYPLTPRPPGKILMKPSGSSNGRSDDDDDDDDELLKGLDPRDSAGSGGGYDDADLEALWSGAGGSDGCGADGLEEREVDGWARLGIGPSDIKRLEEGDDDSGCWAVIAGSLGKRSTGGVAGFGSGPCAVLPRGAVMMRGGIAGALATCGCCTGNVRRLFWGLFMVCGVVLTITTVGA